MKILDWKKNKNTVQKPCYKVGNPCPCGCASKPYIYIFDGMNGLSVKFETIKELNNFKKEVARLGKRRKRRKFNPSLRKSFQRQKNTKIKI